MLEAEKDAADFTATSPTLTGGDVDADWKRLSVSVKKPSAAASPRPTRIGWTTSVMRLACSAPRTTK